MKQVAYTYLDVPSELLTEYLNKLIEHGNRIEVVIRTSPFTYHNDKNYPMANYNVIVS